MGALESTFTVGNTVTIKERNIDVLKSAQKDHGEWTSAMEECFDRPCTVTQAIGDLVLIQAPSGRNYRVNPSLLCHMITFKIGDMVKVKEDIKEVKKLQKGFGEWDDRLEEILGKVVEVVAIRNNGICIVKYGEDKWTLNGHILIPVITEKTPSPLRKLSSGNKVQIIKDKSTMIGLQDGHGGWCDLMTLIVGRDVEVIQHFEDGDCYVKALGMKWLINPRCIEGNQSADTKKFKKGDKVRICNDLRTAQLLQENNGGWNKQMENQLGQQGVVKNVAKNGLVCVWAKGQKFFYNPMLLTLDDSEPIESEITFKVGDFVKVIDDKEVVKRKQAGHGEWVEPMTLILGKKGKIKHIFNDGDFRVKVMGMTLTLNPECVTSCDGDSDSPEIPDFLKMFSDIRKVLDTDSDDEEKPDEIKSKKKRLHTAIKKGDVEEVESLVDQYGINEVMEDATPIHLAAVEGQDEIVRMLLKKNAIIDVKDTQGNSPLHVAVNHGFIEVCDTLISNRADVNATNKKGLTPLMLAALEKNLEIVKLLVSNEKIDIHAMDDDNDTALHIAIHKNCFEIVEVLLNSGADISKENKKGFNAFHLAAMKGNIRILETMLDKVGLTLLDSQKEDGFAALHLAAINNNVECLNFLIQRNADLNIRTNSKQTPLHVAVSQKYIDCVKVLVTSKADLNLKDENGDTPLHVAIKVHNTVKMKEIKGLLSFDFLKMLSGDSDNENIDEIVCYLVRSGAKLDISNNSGNTPIEVCMDDEIKAKILSSRDIKEQQSVIISQLFESKPEESADIKKLQEKIKKLENEKACTICCDRAFNVTFACGHVACDQCAKNLDMCHMCRKPISRVTRIYNL